jgi:hypothetical protein
VKDRVEDDEDIDDELDAQALREGYAGVVRPTFAPRVLVHLVHGTWPYGLIGRYIPALRRRRPPPWFEAGSEFWRDLALKVHCKVELEPFRWSGANSLSARLSAAQRLRDKIANVANVSLRDTCQLIIAHSHGGNVAVWAATEPRTSWGQTDRKTTSECFGVATLGTPFLHLRHRISEPRHRYTLDLLQTVSFFFLLWIATNVATGLTVGLTSETLVWPPPIPEFTWNWQRFLNSAKWLQGFTLAFFFWLGASVVSAVLQLRAIAEPVHSYETGPRTALFESRPILGLLVLRAPGDEAGAILGTTQVADLLLSPVWRGMRALLALMTRVAANRWTSLVLLSPIVLAGPAVQVVMRALLLGESWSLAPESAISQNITPQMLDAGWQWLRPLVVASVPAGLASLALITVLGSLLFVGGVVLMPFGWELIASGLVLEATAEATPPGGTYAVETLHRDLRSDGLRHSMHDLEVTRERLARWIDERYAEWLATRAVAPVHDNLGT